MPFFPKLKKDRRPAKVGRPRSRPFWEIQYHPSDIRKGVRYLFLSRRQAWFLSLGALAYIVFLGVSLWIAPRVLDNYLAKREFGSQQLERVRLGSELKAKVQQLEQVQEQSDAVRLEMAQIHLAYGFSALESNGKGGYPHEPASVPPSIYREDIRRGNRVKAQVDEQFGALSALLEEVQSFEALHQEQVRTTPSISPLSTEDFVLTSPFGKRTSPFTKETDFHPGIDLAAAKGTPIYAPSDGVVAFAGRYPLNKSVGWWRYGNLVAIRHGDRFITLFGHCDEIKTRNGQKVKQGDVVATVGNTGWSTNPHLHYEVRRLADSEDDFKPVDPRIYILDHRWRDSERLLISARQAPAARGYEPLPRLIRR